jgi:hypothetical protein
LFFRNVPFIEDHYYGQQEILELIVRSLHISKINATNVEKVCIHFFITRGVARHDLVESSSTGVRNANERIIPLVNLRNGNMMLNRYSLVIAV